MKILCALLSLIIAFLPAAAFAEQGITGVCIRDACVGVEVAADASARSRGLMFREGLGPDRGMLFVFEEEGRYGFWMKNMRFPLDLIWIGSDRSVRAVSGNVPPCGEGACASVAPAAPVRYVLEVDSGFARLHGIAAGDRVSFLSE